MFLLEADELAAAPHAATAAAVVAVAVVIVVLVLGTVHVLVMVYFLPVSCDDSGTLSARIELTMQKFHGFVFTGVTNRSR